MDTITVTAAQLQSGDKIIDAGTFPRSLFDGVVRSTAHEADQVRVLLHDGGSYARPVDHRFIIERKEVQT